MTSAMDLYLFKACDYSKIDENFTKTIKEKNPKHATFDSVIVVGFSQLIFIVDLQHFWYKTSHP